MEKSFKKKLQEQMGYLTILDIKEALRNLNPYTQIVIKKLSGYRELVDLQHAPKRIKELDKDKDINNHVVSVFLTVDEYRKIFKAETA